MRNYAKLTVDGIVTANLLEANCGLNRGVARRLYLRARCHGTLPRSEGYQVYVITVAVTGWCLVL